MTELLVGVEITSTSARGALLQKACLPRPLADGIREKTLAVWGVGLRGGSVARNPDPMSQTDRVVLWPLPRAWWTPSWEVGLPLASFL